MHITKSIEEKELLMGFFRDYRDKLESDLLRTSKETYEAREISKNLSILRAVEDSYHIHFQLRAEGFSSISEVDCLCRDFKDLASGWLVSENIKYIKQHLKKMFGFRILLFKRICIFFY